MSEVSLPHFLRFLKDESLTELDIEGNFRHRFRIQKYTFIASYFGAGFPYTHKMYIHGPYSPSLASDYYKLAKSHGIPDNFKLPVSFQKKGFLDLVCGKNDYWLEVASTILRIDKDSNPKNKDELTERTSQRKPQYATSFINAVVTDLHTLGLVLKKT